MINLSNPLHLINSNKSIDVQNGQIHKVGFKKTLSTCLNSKAKQKRNERVIEYVKNIFDEISKDTPEEDRAQTFKLAEATISRYKKNSGNKDSISELDSRIVKKRLEIWPDTNIKKDIFQTATNQKNFSRWTKYGHSKKVFVEHFEFANFLMKSHIVSAMPTWGVKVINNENGPSLLVNGKQVHWDEIKDSIELKYHPEISRYRMYDKDTNRPMEYLGAGQGLVICDRYKCDSLPCAEEIRQEEVKHLQTLASKYTRPSEIDQQPDPEVQATRNYVLQVITSENKAGPGNFAQTFQKSNHPFLKLISPDGQVKVVGFVRLNLNLNPLKHGRGGVDSPDIGDFVYSGPQHLTNIAIDEKEAENFKKLCIDLMNEENLTFNFRGQNCTSFVKYVLEDLNLAKFPEAPSAPKVLFHLIFGEKKVTVLKNETKKSSNRMIRTLQKIWRIITTILLKPLPLLLGERPFYKFGQKANPSDNRITRFFKWLIEPVTIDNPPQIQNWQQDAGSTERVIKTKRSVLSSISEGTSK